MAENVQESLTYYQSQAYPTQAQRTYDILLEMIALEALPGKRSTPSWSSARCSRSGGRLCGRR